MPLLGLLHPPLSLEEKRLGDDADCEGPALAGHLRYHRRGARPGAAPHAAGDEDHIGALHRRGDLVAALLDGLAADLGPCPRAESAGEPPLIWILMSDFDIARACASVLTEMNSTPPS